MTAKPSAHLSTAARSQPDVDVLVVGYGPVGATAACLLGRYGLRAHVIDRAGEVWMAPRAIALDHEALRILQLAGLTNTAFPTVPIPQVRMVSPQLGVFVQSNTSGSKDGHPQLVTFYQPDLERALRARAEAYEHITVQLQTTLVDFTETEHGVVATLERADGTRREVSARYLLAADGSNSSVRRAIGQQFRGRSYSEDWLVVDVLNAPQPIDHVEFLCDYRRPTPHMVAPGGRQRWEFMLRKDEKAEHMERVETVRELLAPWGDIDAMTVERCAVYRFHARCCDSFQKGRVFLAGDAAHITPPFIGQGLVAGLRDVANLCWKLSWVISSRAAPQLLDTYDQERRPHAQQIIRLATQVGQLIMPRSAARAVFTHGLLRALRLVPVLAKWLEHNDIKPPTRFRKGLFIAGRTRAKLTRGGMFPQAQLRDANGETRLSDDVLGPSLACVGLDVEPEHCVTAQTRAAFLEHGGRFITLRTSSGAGGQGYEDISGTFARTMRRGWVAVVRPDRVVLHDGPRHSADRLLSDTLALLGASAKQPAETEELDAARDSLRA